MPFKKFTMEIAKSSNGRFQFHVKEDKNVKGVFSLETRARLKMNLR